MAGYLNFNFVEKHKSFITGRTPSLQMYEALLVLVEQHYFNDNKDAVSFYNGGYIFSEFGENAGNSWEYYTYPIDCYFIDMASTLSSLQEEIYEPNNRKVFLFEIELIKHGIVKVIKQAQTCGLPDEKRVGEELKTLNTFFRKLNQYSNKNLLIACSFN